MSRQLFIAIAVHVTLTACNKSPDKADAAKPAASALGDAEITNIPFLAALAGALRRCNPLV